jgi:Fe2+ or Zn2+ uptake regulation protein
MGSGNGTRDAVELLRGQGMRMTPQRLAIVDEIMSTAGYVIPTTVIERVQARVPGVSPSTAHLTCARCGADLELSRRSLRSLERLVERDHGFRPDFSHYAISGVCAACLQEER